MSTMTIQQPSIFGQIPMDFYTQVLLGFSISDSDNVNAVVNHLSAQAEVLAHVFPHLSGNVVVDGRSPHDSGTYRVRTQKRDIVRVRDCTKHCPSFTDILDAQATGSVLDGNLLSPMKGIPEHHHYTSEGLPVWILQINLVRGGLIVCSSCMHQSFDMNGHGHLLNLLATQCRGERFTSKDRVAGNLDGAIILPVLSNDEPILDHSALRHPSNLDPSTAASQDAPSAPPAPWVYFRISRSSINELKSAALSTVSLRSSEYVSSNDVLTAFLWQRVSLTRVNRFSPQESTLLGRLVDIRQRLEEAHLTGYMGHLLLLDELTSTFDTLAQQSLGTIACQLRRSLQTYHGHYVRSLAHTLRAEADKSVFRYGANSVTGRDVTVSSWAGLGFGSTSFGAMLGVPRFVRRPNQADCEGLIYLMPVASDGSIDITMSLRNDDLKSLRDDRIWNQYVDFLG